MQNTLIGRIAQLTVIKKSMNGLILENNIELPQYEITQDKKINIGDKIEVFIQNNEQGALTATTLIPYIEVGKFADLQVVESADFGLFLNWGMPKDLLLPKREIVGKLEIDDFTIVYAYIDQRTQRVTATMKYEKHLDQTTANYSQGDAVTILVAGRTPLGLKVIVNNTHWGLIYRNDIVGDIDIGDETTAYIKEMREDGKIDIQINPIIKTHEGRNQLENNILNAVSKSQGKLYLSDKSNPEDIHRILGVSKSAFKKAIGALYKSKKIIIHSDHITLNEQ